MLSLFSAHLSLSIGIVFSSFYTLCCHEGCLLAEVACRKLCQPAWLKQLPILNLFLSVHFVTFFDKIIKFLNKGNSIDLTWNSLKLLIQFNLETCQLRQGLIQKLYGQKGTWGKEGQYCKGKCWVGGRVLVEFLKNQFQV